VKLRDAGPKRDAVGAWLRLVYADGEGPVRETHVGAGYWSQDGAVQVLGVDSARSLRGLWVRWPDGSTQEHRLDASAIGTLIDVRRGSEP
jgi:hypothetical protein